MRRDLLDAGDASPFVDFGIYNKQGGIETDSILPIHTKKVQVWQELISRPLDVYIHSSHRFSFANSIIFLIQHFGIVITPQN